LERHVRTCGVIYKSEIANGIIAVRRVAFGCTPAIGQAIVGIVLLAENFDICLIQFVRHAAILIEMPGRGLAFAVRQS